MVSIQMTLKLLLIALIMLFIMDVATFLVSILHVGFLRTWRAYFVSQKITPPLFFSALVASCSEANSAYVELSQLLSLTLVVCVRMLSLYIVQAATVRPVDICTDPSA